MLLRSGIVAAGGPTFVPEVLGTLTGFAGGAYLTMGATYGYLGVSGSFLVFDHALNQVALLNSGSTYFNGSHHAAISSDENWAFVSAEQGNNITSVDISNKSAPVLGQKYVGPAGNTSLAGINMGELDGTVMACACWSRHSIAFVNVTDPLAMGWYSEFRGVTPGTTVKNARRVSLDTVNKICYYVCDNTGAGVHRFGAIDYSDPTTPTELWSLATADVDSARGCFWDSAHDLVWTCSSGGSPYYGALTAWYVDPSNRAVAPTKIGQWKGSTGYTSVDSITACRSVDFITVGGMRYAAVVSESPNSICTFDVTDPTNIQRVGKLRDTTKFNQPMGVKFGSDGKAYVSNLSNATPTIAITKVDLHLT